MRAGLENIERDCLVRSTPKTVVNIILKVWNSTPEILTVGKLYEWQYYQYSHLQIHMVSCFINKYIRYNYKGNLNEEVNTTCM
jgi:hypothetical protein